MRHSFPIHYSLCYDHLVPFTHRHRHRYNKFTLKRFFDCKPFSSFLRIGSPLPSNKSKVLPKFIPRTHNTNYESFFYPHRRLLTLFIRPPSPLIIVLYFIGSVFLGISYKIPETVMNFIPFVCNVSKFVSSLSHIEYVSFRV